MPSYSSSPFDRVVVVGSSCAGKTTLASRIAELRGCKHIELDALHWLPDWVERPVEEFRALTERAVADDFWVLDGNYSRTRDLVWSRATAVVWLNYSFPRVFSRALWRTARRVAQREELYSGNRETLRLALFDRESILWWVISTHRRRRREYLKLFRENSFSQARFIELRRAREADELLESLRDD